MNKLDRVRGADSVLPRGSGRRAWYPIPPPQLTLKPELLLRPALPPQSYLLWAPMCLFKTSLLKGSVSMLSTCYQNCSESEGGKNPRKWLVEPLETSFPTPPSEAPSASYSLSQALETSFSQKSVVKNWI